ncbi:hypothetical protein D3C71_1877210 [compost metagenome]
MAGAHGGGVDIPVHGDGVDIEHRIHQPLIAQVTEHQQLGLCAQRHQGDQLAFVYIDREWPFSGNLHLLALAEFIDDLHCMGEWRTRLCQIWQLLRGGLSGGR